MSTNNRFKDNPLFRPVFFAVLASVLVFIACNDNKLTLGEKYIESQTDINLIDTLSVSLSTMILDTVVTSNSGSLLVGNFRDGIFGEIASRSYFQIAIPDSFYVEENDVYDSLRLAILYNGYAFGDADRSQQITVHQLTENIELDENSIITSDVSFNYNPDPIGSVVHIPSQHSEADTLFIRIDDRIGLDLFAKMKDNSEYLADDESFMNYFHGLVLMEDDGDEGSIIGFNTDVKLILYTSRTELAHENINYEFGIEDFTKQFNHIMHDFASTRLNVLDDQKNDLPSAKTDGLSFLQGGLGLVLKVEFPSLPEILLRERGKIVKAQLSISPLASSYSDFKLPSELAVYESDKLNSLLDEAGEVALSVLTVDELYKEATVYLFDISNYLIEELADSYVDPDKGLIIALPSSYLNATFYRLVVDAENRNTKLKIYYLSY
jgi:hypothetical protein